jgi:signal peptidase I
VSVGAAVIVGTATALALAVSAWLSWCRANLVTVVVDGSSMAPTLSARDRVVVRRVRGHRLTAGQLVVFAAPVREAGAWVWWPADDPMAPAWAIKRIAAVAADPVPPAVASAVPAAVVPAGSIVVLGDKLDGSIDSRLFGQVPIECVLGSLTGGPRRDS